jgi:4-carboxymuconolactone decarboxylase
VLVPVTDPESTRWEAGLARYLEVYGDDAVTFERGQFEFFDLMIEQLFAELWTRPALSIPERRLLTIGVLAARGHFDLLELQFVRALETGELTAAQVREVVIHLVAYAGYPSSGGLIQSSEAAIASVSEQGPR